MYIGEEYETKIPEVNEIEKAKQYMYAVSTNKNLGGDLLKSANFSGKLAVLGGVCGLFYGVVTKRSVIGCIACGTLIFGGVSYIANSYFDNVENEVKNV